jgi:hypothetical protein
MRWIAATQILGLLTEWLKTRRSCAKLVLPKPEFLLNRNPYFSTSKKGYSMTKGFWIVMYNSFGCEINRDFVRETSEEMTQLMLKEAIGNMVQDSVLASGDSFKIEEGESELD